MILYSILIVSHNRKYELESTLEHLITYIPPYLIENTEILVYLDGCNDDSDQLEQSFSNVIWYSGNEKIGASKSRKYLYQKARGKILFGFDDDAKPVQQNFIEIAEEIFSNDMSIGIISFKQLFFDASNDYNLVASRKRDLVFYESDEFIACGFCILKDVYYQSGGFSDLVNIYGEEKILSLWVQNAGYKIIFTNLVEVNHQKRPTLSQPQINVFRFRNQFLNNLILFTVYLPINVISIKFLIRCITHNFIKYAIKDGKAMLAFFNVIFIYFKQIRFYIRSRNPIAEAVYQNHIRLPQPHYSIQQIKL